MNTIKPKRGRRSKKEMMELENAKALESVESKESTEIKEVIVSVVEAPVSAVEASVSAYESEMKLEETVEAELSDNVDTNLAEEPVLEPVLAKKRGRKPKGGKIIQQNILNNVQFDDKPNVILHLKCSLKDIQSDTFNSSNIESFNFNSSKSELSYQVISSSANKNMSYNFNPSNSISTSNYNDADEDVKEKDKDKEIWRKLKVLEHNLHINNISDKKSACFWCSYEFDNNPIYIPKHFIKNSYSVYGCFCSPECATAHLMEENIDSSTKFERYYLLNHIYAKIYNYTKNIKPAPNPYYMLNKYYGNLTIQEYRALLKSERLFLIVDKPLTRILPEFHEDNDEFIINNKIIPTNNNNNNYSIKKNQTKNNIVSEHFGLTSTF